MFNPKDLKTFEDWKLETLDQLLDNYEFNLHEALTDFDEETAERLTTFKDYCAEMYFSYIEDLLTNE